MFTAINERVRAFRVGLGAIQKHWASNHEIIDNFSPEFRHKAAEKLIQEIMKIVFSPDARMANRKKLSCCVIEMAQFQVLVIDPAPSNSFSDLRNQPGVTGELKARLFDLAHKDKGLIELFHGFDENLTADDIWNTVLLRYRMCHAWTHVFNTLRLAFDDCNPSSEKDWFHPFLAAICGWEEYHYREVLGMPSALDKSCSPLHLSTFVDCVLSGARYPDLEWNKIDDGLG